MSYAETFRKYKEYNQRKKFNKGGGFQMEPLEITSNIGGVGLQYNETLNTAAKQPTALDSSGYGQNTTNTMGTIGAYAGLAGSAIDSISGYQQQPQDATYDAVMGAVGMAGPVGGVISGVSGLGHAIGGPIRQEAEAINENTGKYEDIGAATAGGYVGSLFDPFYSGVSSLENEYSDSGDKAASIIGMLLGPGVGTAIQGAVYQENLEEAEAARVNQLEAARRQKLFDQNYNFFNSNQYNQSAYGNTFQLKNGGKMSYAEGGNIQKDIPGTSLTNPVNTIDYYGPDHNQGGIPIGSNTEVEGGEVKLDDYIFSDKIAYNG